MCVDHNTESRTQRQHHIDASETTAELSCRKVSISQHIIHPVPDNVNMGYISSGKHDLLIRRSQRNLGGKSPVTLEIRHPRLGAHSQCFAMVHCRLAFRTLLDGMQGDVQPWRS